MAGFMDILGSMVEQGMSQSSGARMSSALGAGSGSGSLNDIIGGLGQMLGGGQAGAPSSTGTGGMGGVLGEVLQTLGSNKAAAGGLGALAGALLGGGKSSARGAVGGGGLAVLASLAFSALQKAGQKPQPPRALFEPETALEQEALEHDAEVIVKAMINAAKADNRIDETEIEKIVGKLEEDGLTNEEKDFFMQEARKPMDTDAVVRAADTSAEMAAQIYAASLLAIEVDTPAERRYMQELADRLGLDSRVTKNIEGALGMV